MYGVPQGSMLGPLLFLLFINDFPMFMRVKSTPILFAGDTSVLISHSKLSDFKNKIKSIFNNLNECFKNNLVSLNFSKTQFVRFTTRHTNQMEIIIDHDNKTDTLMNNGTNLSLTAACVADGVLSVFVLHVSPTQLHSCNAQYNSRNSLGPPVLSCVRYGDAVIIVGFVILWCNISFDYES
jgi:hypothetical protein